MIADVVLPLPLDQTFTYRIPATMQARAQAGCRVLVPFGPRRLTGVVVAVHPDGQEPATGYALKDVLDVFEEEPACTRELLRLTRWMADYYACSWGEALRATLPSGTDIETQLRVRRTEPPPSGSPPEGTAQVVLRALDTQPDASVASLRQQVGTVSTALLRRLEAHGWVEIWREERQARVRVKRERHLRLAPTLGAPAALQGAMDTLRGAKQRAVLEALSGLVAEGHAIPPQAEVLARADASASTVRSLVQKGLVETVEREVDRTPSVLEAPAGASPSHTLHPAQQAALAHLEGAIAARRYETVLLHGVTGSGKTEVYIAALKAARAQGRTGIVLVPEIALTPQTVRRFRQHFGEEVAVLHSRMSLGERYDAWRALRSGRRPIVVGPRSAVLAPLSNLGLLVVDEEHEASYKQFDPAPRYHARDVAVMRAHMNDAVCLLGSATPSLESWVNARAGKYTRLSMPARVPVPGRTAASLPTVQVVDLTKHRPRGALSVPLQQAIRARLHRQEQVILLQNRRGYAPILECDDCGWTPSCPDCAVTLTYHKPQRHLRCHYCGRAFPVPRVCSSCEAPGLSLLGTGTQRVEEELHACFPEARILRMDLDTTSRKDAHHTLLGRFRRGEADILLGTQMVAKGLDFGRVTLVGVINADTGLLLPDFRAEERTFQLLTQVAGRAGRSRLPGEVVLQTRNPTHSALTYALRHDYEGFVAAVLPERHALGYPPYQRVVRIEFRGPGEREVATLAQRWTGGFDHPHIEVLGPGPALISRVKRTYRHQTLLKVPRTVPSGELRAALQAAHDQAGRLARGYRVAVDVDALGV
ncbi:MAG: primosomal protein N' [Bacteroidota bacterium]